MFRNRYGKAAVDNVHHMFKLRAEPLGGDGAVRLRKMTYVL